MLLQVCICFNQNIPGFAALVRTYDTGCFKLVHQPAGTVIAQLHAALQ